MRILGFAALVVIGLAIPLTESTAAGGANRCTVSITPVQFGTYNPLLPADVRSTGIVTYNCTMSLPITISLNRGVSTSYEDRRMGQGFSALGYNLYLDAAGTMIWGDGTGGSQVYRDPAPAPNTNISVPIYSRVPARQHGAHTGFYTDNLMVTINY